MELDFFNSNREPDFVNELGVKWWRQKTHINQEKSDKLEAKGFSSWYTENEKGDDKNLIVLKGEDIVKVSSGIEVIGVFMDAMWLVYCT
ncbi:hypothetical protein KAR91_38065 [Candidatus Pacearchaeota archaeon]|nr:hypothetical protein [Candidatus Pacearchaeota archaeon]